MDYPTGDNQSAFHPEGLVPEPEVCPYSGLGTVQCKSWLCDCFEFPKAERTMQEQERQFFAAQAWTERVKPAQQPYRPHLDPIVMPGIIPF